MKPRIAKTMPQHTPKIRAGMDKAHLFNVGRLPCLACGAHVSDIQTHHLLRTGEHGMGRKSSDQWAVPLSVNCHRDLHSAGDEDEWFAARGIDARSVARALWTARGNVEAMRRVVFAARQRAALKLKQGA